MFGATTEDNALNTYHQKARTALGVSAKPCPNRDRINSNLTTLFISRGFSLKGMRGREQVP